MKMIKIYSKPNCVQCVATYKELERKGIQYEVIDLTTDNEAFDYVQSLGYSSVPVVMYGDIHWSGFRPDKIATIKLVAKE